MGLELLCFFSFTIRKKSTNNTCIVNFYYFAFLSLIGSIQEIWIIWLQRTCNILTEEAYSYCEVQVSGYIFAGVSAIFSKCMFSTYYIICSWKISFAKYYSIRSVINHDLMSKWILLFECMWCISLLSDFLSPSPLAASAAICLTAKNWLVYAGTLVMVDLVDMVLLWNKILSMTMNYVMKVKHFLIF